MTTTREKSLIIFVLSHRQKKFTLLHCDLLVQYNLSCISFHHFQSALLCPIYAPPATARFFAASLHSIKSLPCVTYFGASPLVITIKLHLHIVILLSMATIKVTMQVSRRLISSNTILVCL